MIGNCICDCISDCYHRSLKLLWCAAIPDNSTIVFQMQNRTNMAKVVPYHEKEGSQTGVGQYRTNTEDRNCPSVLVLFVYA